MGQQKSYVDSQYREEIKLMHAILSHFWHDSLAWKSLQQNKAVVRLVK